MFAYTIFGFCGLVFSRHFSFRSIILVFMTAIISTHLFSQHLKQLLFIHLTWDFGAVRIIPCFILGMLICKIAPYISTPVSVAAGVFGLFFLVLFAGRPDAGYELFLSFALIILSGARLSGSRFMPLNGRMFVYLGEISYSTYLVHAIVIAVVFDYLPKLLNIELLNGATFQVGLTLALVLVASVACYHLVERPARDYLNRRL
jgi:peptidoglycan/LPS O-acetylase OafA/YrhL